MYAALKGHTIQGFLFEGTDYEGPDWFDDMILPDCETDCMYNLVWSQRDASGQVCNAVTVEPGEGVILFNPSSGIQFMLLSPDEFDIMFLNIGDNWNCALREDCVEYFCFEDYNESNECITEFNVNSKDVPYWVREHLIRNFNGVDFDSFGVFIRNRIGKVQYLDNATFLSCYEY